MCGGAASAPCMEAGCLPSHHRGCWAGCWADLGGGWAGKARESWNSRQGGAGRRPGVAHPQPRCPLSFPFHPSLALPPSGGPSFLSVFLLSQAPAAPSQCLCSRQLSSLLSPVPLPLPSVSFPHSLGSLGPGWGRGEGEGEGREEEPLGRLALGFFSRFIIPRSI